MSDDRFDEYEDIIIDDYFDPSEDFDDMEQSVSDIFYADGKYDDGYNDDDFDGNSGVLVPV